MELLFVLALALLSLAAGLVHRHLQVAAWNRELQQAFGTGAEREMPRHRSL